MSREKITSQWAHLDEKIKKAVVDHADLGYTDIAKKVLPKGSYRDYDLLRTYIRRSFGHLREKARGESSSVNPPKILIYDLETSRIPAKVWWTGKQFIGHKQLLAEPAIITVAWKFLGEDKVHYLTWDEEHSDKKLVEEFCKVYNSADEVVGINNDNFDNRWLAARAAKHNIVMSPHIKSFDIQKKAKSVFRLPSYSMEYMAKYFGVSNKLSHEGISMWDKVEDGNKKEQREGLKAMVEYNIGDIIATEDLYLVLRKYMKGISHLGVLNGKAKFSCPECGGTNLELVKTMTTTAGTIQRVMRCLDDDVTFKISNKNYIKFLDAQDEGNTSTNDE